MDSEDLNAAYIEHLAELRQFIPKLNSQIEVISCTKWIQRFQNAIDTEFNARNYLMHLMCEQLKRGKLNHPFLELSGINRDLEIIAQELSISTSGCRNYIGSNCCTDIFPSSENDQIGSGDRQRDNNIIIRADSDVQIDELNRFIEDMTQINHNLQNEVHISNQKRMYIQNEIDRWSKDQNNLTKAYSITKIEPDPFKTVIEQKDNEVRKYRIHFLSYKKKYEECSKLLDDHKRLINEDRKIIDRLENEIQEMKKKNVSNTLAQNPFESNEVINYIHDVCQLLQDKCVTLSESSNISKLAQVFKFDCFSRKFNGSIIERDNIKQLEETIAQQFRDLFQTLIKDYELKISQLMESDQRKIKDIENYYDRKVRSIEQNLEENKMEITQLEKIISRKNLLCSKESQTEDMCNLLQTEAECLQDAISKIKNLRSELGRQGCSHLKKIRKYEYKIQKLKKEHSNKEKALKLELATLKSEIMAETGAKHQKELEQVTNDLELKYKTILVEAIQNQKTEMI